MIAQPSDSAPKAALLLSPRTQVCQSIFNAFSKPLDAIQILNGNGYTNDYPLGRLLRDAKLYEIGAG
jgi:hypothetical protein